LALQDPSDEPAGVLLEWIRLEMEAQGGRQEDTETKRRGTKQLQMEF